MIQSPEDLTYFNPPSPCGEGPIISASFFLRLLFQSTLPMRGGTIVVCSNGTDYVISIHPPHAGRDEEFQTWGPVRKDFNPPSPCGEGQGGSPPLIFCFLFQSTLPMRGGTAQVHKIYLETYAHITKQAIYTGTYSEVFKVFPHIMAYFAVFFYANLPGNLCLLPLRIIK